MKTYILKISDFPNAIKDVINIANNWMKEANNTFNFIFNVKRHIEDLYGMVDNSNSDLIVLKNEDDRIVGYMGVTVFTSPISEQKLCNEHYWYVLPSARGLGSLRLIKAAKEWAKLKECSHLILNASYLASDKHDKVCELYEKFGAEKFETSYIMEI